MRHVKPHPRRSAKTRALISLACAIFLAGFIVCFWPQLVGIHLDRQAQKAVSDFFDMSAAPSSSRALSSVSGPTMMTGRPIKL